LDAASAHLALECLWQKVSKSSINLVKIGKNLKNSLQHMGKLCYNTNVAKYPRL